MLRYGDLQLSGSALANAVEQTFDIVPTIPFNLDVSREREETLLKHFGFSSFKAFEKDVLDRYAKASSIGDANRWTEELRSVVKQDIVPHLFCADEIGKALATSHVKIQRPKQERSINHIYIGHGDSLILMTNQHLKSKMITYKNILHEIYPGKHFYYVCRDTIYQTELMGEEISIDLAYSAERPINEGITEIGLFLLNSLNDELKRDLQISMTHEQLEKEILYNGWYRHYVSEEISHDELVAYIRKGTAWDEAKIVTTINTIDIERVYYPLYPLGLERVRNYLKKVGALGISALYIPKTASILQSLMRYQASHIVNSATDADDNERVLL
jgi:hypothetical protein